MISTIQSSARALEERMAEQLVKKNLSCESVQLSKNGHRIQVDINTALIDYRGEAAVLSIMRGLIDREQAVQERLSLEAAGAARPETRRPGRSGCRRCP